MSPSCKVCGDSNELPRACTVNCICGHGAAAHHKGHTDKGAAIQWCIDCPQSKALHWFKGIRYPKVKLARDPRIAGEPLVCGPCRQRKDVERVRWLAQLEEA